MEFEKFKQKLFQSMDSWLEVMHEALTHPSVELDEKIKIGRYITEYCYGKPVQTQVISKGFDPNQLESLTTKQLIDLKAKNEAKKMLQLLKPNLNEQEIQDYLKPKNECKEIIIKEN